MAGPGVAWRMVAELVKGPKTATQLREAIGAKEDTIYRNLREGQSFGALEIHGNVETVLDSGRYAIAWKLASPKR